MQEQKMRRTTTMLYVVVVCCVYVSIRNQHSLPPNKTDLAGKCIKSTGECSISTYDEKQGSACDDGNRRTMNDVCKNGECVGVSVNTGRGTYYPWCYRKCPQHSTCRSRTYYRREWTGRSIGWRPYTASACSCAPGYYGSTHGSDGVSGKGWNQGGHGGLREWPRFDGKCYECALGEYSDYWSNGCKKCSPGTYTEVTRTANACIDCWPGRYGVVENAHLYSYIHDEKSQFFLFHKTQVRT